MRVKLIFGETDTLSFGEIQSMLADRVFYVVALLTALLVIFANPYHYLLPVSIFEWVKYFAIHAPICVILYVCIKFAFITIATTYNWRYIYEPLVTFVTVVLTIPFCKASADLAFREYNFDLPQLYFSTFFDYIILEGCITLYWHKFLRKRKLKYNVHNYTQLSKDQSDLWITVGCYTIEVSTLVWIRSEDHKIRIKCANQQDIVLRENLKSVLSQLKSTDGILIHRSTWVSRSGIDKLIKDGGKQSLQTTDGHLHSVAKSREVQLLEWLEQAIAAQKTPKNPTPTCHFIGGNTISVTPTELVRLMMHPKTMLFWFATSFATVFLNPSVLVSGLPYTIWMIFWLSQSTFFFILYSCTIIVFNAAYRAAGFKNTLHITTAGVAVFIVHYGSVEFTNWFTAPLGYTFTYSVIFALSCALMLECFASIFVAKIYPMFKSEICDGVAVDAFGLELQVQIDTYSLALGDILHVKSDGHYLEVATKRAKYYVKGTIASLEAQISDTFAVSPHRSYWIPRHAIKATQQAGGKLLLKLTDGHAVSVARGRRDAVLYWMKNGRSVA